MNGYGDAPHGYSRPRRRPGGNRGGRGFGGGRRDNRARRQSCPPELRDAFVGARDFLAGLIAALGLPARLSFGGVDPARDGRQITIEVSGIDNGRRQSNRFNDEERDDDGLAILIGKHGATLDALSAVTNAAMHRGESRDVFFAVDVEGYRQRRIATLRAIAQRCATRVMHEGVAVELEPMPPSERRIIHLSLASHRDVATESTGAGKERRVVIMPRGSVLPVDDNEEDFS